MAGSGNERVLVNQMVGVSAKSLFSTLFSGSAFFEKVAIESNPSVTKFVASPWQIGKDRSSRNIGYEFTKTVAMRGYRITVKEVQTQMEGDKNKLVVACLVENSGFVFADCFDVLTLYEITEASETSCVLTVTGKIVWTASCWFAPTIEIETWAGLEKYFDAMKLCLQHLGEESAIPAEPSSVSPLHTLATNALQHQQEQQRQPAQEPRPVAAEAADDNRSEVVAEDVDRSNDAGGELISPHSEPRVIYIKCVDDRHEAFRRFLVALVVSLGLSYLCLAFL